MLLCMISFLLLHIQYSDCYMGCRVRGRMVVGFITTYAIGTYHH